MAGLLLGTTAARTAGDHMRVAGGRPWQVGCSTLFCTACLSFGILSWFPVHILLNLQTERRRFGVCACLHITQPAT